jgi:hypothetical protein
MLAYSPDSEPSRAFLLRAYNDLEIYVEDVASQNMYVRLFNRMLDGLGTISNVFPLHDRSRVIAACQADRGGSLPKRLYVIDGDFDLLLGNSPPVLGRLYRLSVYCSENLLLSERAVLEIGAECATSTTRANLVLALGLRDFLLMQFRSPCVLGRRRAVFT